MARGLQKQQSQAKNAGVTEKTAEQRAADRKAAEANMAAYACGLCKQTFASTAKAPMLRDHWANKHPKDPPDDVMTKGFPTFKWNESLPAKKAAKGGAAEAAAAAVAAAGGGGASKKEKSKEAAAIAAAALAAVAAGKPAAAKREKKKQETATGDAAEKERQVSAETEESPPAVCMEVDAEVEAVEAEVEVENSTPVITLEEVGEEEKAARDAAKVEADRIEANHEASADALAAGELVTSVRAMISSKKGVGIDIPDLDSLLAAADVNFVVKR